ncbi:MAG: daunorubicin ABC transporter ATP-binding protein [Mesoaciditoga sp.]|uniref:ABC transporter ATP-binding protein n=1 Tax=Athalassotoga sp. TaxID=2022597 RepID=UPI000CC33A25|nr:MAG: daunorubicin ABC transporter ATP-binding protein [Mesoaciditoga sp.]PMP80299.1 MAG: daunorubicin ABC transporter ATP-binding protein [Mesoaciditoga sp.]
MEDKAIVVKNLKKYFKDVKAVDDISFEVGYGQLFALLGQNGAGKSTTIRILTNLAVPTSGYVEVAGYNVLKNPTEVRKNIGLVAEKVILYNDLTAMENIKFFGRLYGMKDPEIYDRAEKFLKLFDIWDFKDILISKMSTGMKQKINLARALVPDPKIIFLDEPTLGLDPVSTKHIRDFIVQLREEGRTIVYTTHVLHDVELMNVDKVAIMRKGKIVAMGTLNEIRKHFKKAEIVEIETDRTLSFNDPKIKILEQEDGYAKVEVEDLNQFMSYLTKANIKVRSFKSLEPSLEDIYVEISEGKLDAEIETVKE